MKKNGLGEDYFLIVLNYISKVIKPHLIFQATLSGQMDKFALERSSYLSTVDLTIFPRYI